MTGHLAPRLRAHGESVFTTMSRLALEHDAINLGQGFPDEDGPRPVVEAARRALADGHNQYPPARGIPALRTAIARHQHRYHGLDVDPDDEVVVTTGATGALSAALLALVEPGDEVVLLEPYYDAYPALVDLAGGTRRTVPLRHGRPLEREALAAACSPRTAVIVVNTPHNPLGRVLTPAELALVAEQAAAHDAVVVSDEVYEHMTFDGHAHTPVAGLPGMAERTLTIGSAGKTFSVTGWKVGWASGPADLVEAVAAVAQWLTFSGGTPFQHAVAEGLERLDEIAPPMVDSLRRRRDLLVDGLARAGLKPHLPEGTYFVVADTAPLGVTDASAWCRELPARHGVAAVPVAALCDDPTVAATLARFAFCKSEERIVEGCRRLAERPRT